MNHNFKKNHSQLAKHVTVKLTMVCITCCAVGLEEEVDGECSGTEEEDGGGAEEGIHRIQRLLLCQLSEQSRRQF